MCLRYAQMFSYVHRCFQMITDVFGFSEKMLQKIVQSGNYQPKLKKGKSQGAILCYVINCQKKWTEKNRQISCKR